MIILQFHLNSKVQNQPSRCISTGVAGQCKGVLMNQSLMSLYCTHYGSYLQTTLWIAALNEMGERHLGMRKAGSWQNCGRRVGSRCETGTWHFCQIQAPFPGKLHQSLADCICATEIGETVPSWSIGAAATLPGVREKFPLAPDSATAAPNMYWIQNRHAGLQNKLGLCLLCYNAVLPGFHARTLY